MALENHTIEFTSISYSATFESEQRITTAKSDSVSMRQSNTATPLGFILKEDGGMVLIENGLPLAQEWPGT